MTKNTHRPLVLIILDGFGYREEKTHNAIAAAHTPCWDKLWQHYAHTCLAGSGRCVGLPQGQMGNSEVGHLTMGAGRVIHQDLTRIDLAIEQGDFFHQPILMAAFEKARTTDKKVHVLGLLSPGGVHAHEKHMHALVTMAAKFRCPNLLIHAFLDGRDTPPRSAEASLQSLVDHCKTEQCGRIASIIGRYYAMDRDNRWDRVEQAYNLLTTGTAAFTAPDAIKALQMAYARGETDEFVQATSIHATDTQPPHIEEGDVVIFMNFRSDRARELSQAFLNPDFTGFERASWPKLGEFVCLTPYDNRFVAPVVFKPEPLTNLLGEYLSAQGLTQLRIAETEKYAHVTFFFNGGKEAPSKHEDRILIPSPSVATYDLQPEMSANGITTALIAAIKQEKYDVIICNFANADMVGHTGNMTATIQAIETIDHCLAEITQSLLAAGGELIITADHGNAEQMYDATTQQPHTAHTSDPVPFVFVGREATIVKENGKLSDIAPTMLYLLGLPIPTEMTGSPLVSCN